MILNINYIPLNQLIDNDLGCNYKDRWKWKYQGYGSRFSSGDCARME